MKKKSYKITFALKEGYAPKGKVHSVTEAAKIIESWMVERINNGEPVVSGMLQEGQLFFLAPEGNKQVVIVSPTAVYYGELSSPAELKRTDAEIKETLASLARKLKEAFKQESVFIIYRDLNWCV